MKIYPKAATLPGKEGAYLQDVWLYLQQIFYPFHSKDMNSNSPNCLPQIYYNVSSENLVSKSKWMSFLIFFIILISCLLMVYKIWLRETSSWSLTLRSEGVNYIFLILLFYLWNTNL